MKNKYTHAILLLSLVGISSALKAQIRIVNSTTNQAATNSSAFIDASSNISVNTTPNIGKGLLFPRTDLSKFTGFGGTGIGTSGSYPYYYDGFIVYNTATSGAAGIGNTQGALAAGYWFYDNKTTTIGGGTWKPVTPADNVYIGSTSVTLNGTSIERAALTGDVTAGANSNATTVSGLRGRTVSATAPANGQVLKYNTATTAWEPAADADTSVSYTAGSGMALTGTTFSATDASITAKGIVQLAGDLTGTSALPAIANSAVSSAKIADGTIVAADMADGAVTTGKILDGTIITADIANSAVTAAKIAGSTTNGQVLTTNASGVTSWVTPDTGLSAEVDGIIGNEVVSATANGGLLRAGAGTAASPYTLGLTTGTAANQVMKWNGTAWAPGTDDNTNTTYTASTSVLLNGNSFQRAALTGDVTAAANTNATTIAANAITSAKILDGTIATADIDDDAVTTGKILDGTIAAADIANNAITVAKLPTGATATTFLRGDGTWVTPAGGLTAEVDGIIGNEVVSATTNGGLLRAGAGTAASPYTLGLTTGTAANQVMKWNGTAWAPGTDDNTNITYTGSTSIALNGTSFERAALTGDVTAAANTNATTIAANAVTSAKIADGTIAADDIANNAVTVAKLPAGATATTFLRGDGTWAAPAAPSLPTLYTADGTISSSRTVSAGNNIINITNTNSSSGPLQLTAKPATSDAQTTEVLKLFRPGVVGVTDGQAASLNLGTIGGSAARLDFKLTGSAYAGNNWGGTPDITPMSISSEGKVGINTNAPFGNLDVVGNIYTSLHKSTNLHDALERGTYRIGALTAGQSYAFSGMVTEIKPYSSGNGSYINFDTWGYNKSDTRHVMTIDPNGYVGIGITNPTTALDIVGQVKISGGTPGAGKVLTSDANGLATWITPSTTAYTANNGLNLSGNDIRLGGNLSGNTTIGIGGNTLSFTGSGALRTEGEVRVGADAQGYIRLKPGSNTQSGHMEIYKPSGVRVGYIGYDPTNLTYNAENGAIHVFNTTIQAPRIQGSSDRRFKENIKPIYQATEKLNQLNGYTYTWKDRKEFPGQVLGEGKDMGVIAQEVEAVLPDAVSTNKDGYKSVNYSALIPVLIEALKESNKKVNTLEDRLNALETKK